MIRCSKCGKLYDYDKYNGICPACARYNRADSAQMEQELHERYDSIPNAHAAEEHRKEVHRRNQGSGRSRRGMAAAVCIIIAAAVILLGVVPFLRTVIQSQGFTGPDFHLNAGALGDGGIFGEEKQENEPHVEYAWMNYAGRTLGEINWGDLAVTLNERDEESLAAVTDKGDGAYYLISINIQNDSPEDLYLSEVVPEDVEFQVEGEVIPCQAAFYSYYGQIDPGTNGYLDCLVYFPDALTAQYEENGSMQFSGTLSVEGELLPDFEVEYWFD